MTPQKTPHDIGEMASRAITETEIVIIDPKQPRNASISGGLDAAMNREKSLLGHFQKQKRDHELSQAVATGNKILCPHDSVEQLRCNLSDIIY